MILQPNFTILMMSPSWNDFIYDQPLIRATFDIDLIKIEGGHVWDFYPAQFCYCLMDLSIKVKPDNLGIKIKRVTRAFQKYFVFIVWSIFSLKMHACKNNKIVQSLEVVPLTLPSWNRWKPGKKKRCLGFLRF